MGNSQSKPDDITTATSNNNKDATKSNDNSESKPESTDIAKEDKASKTKEKQKELAALSEDIIPKTEVQQQPKQDEAKDNKNDDDKEEEPGKDGDKDDGNKDIGEEKKDESLKVTSVEMEDKGSYYFVKSNLDPQMDRDVVSLLALSDTLGTHSMDMMKDIPSVDILIHAGNFTQDGTLQQVQDFNIWINTLLDTKKCKYAVIIAGNHEITFDKQYYDNIKDKKIDLQQAQNNGDNDNDANMEKPTDEGLPNNADKNEEGQNEDNMDEGDGKQNDETTTGKKEENENETDMTKKCRNSIKNAIYLENEGIEILGLKFYGTPLSLMDKDDKSRNKAFCLEKEEELREKYENIPYDVDVMISHYPPYLHSDGAGNIGSKALINKLEVDVQPNVCVFGHITSCHGVTRQSNMDAAFINATCANEESQIDKKPIMFYLQPKLESFF